MDMPADPAAPATPAPTSSDMSTTMMDQVDMSKTFTMTDKNFAIKMHTGNNYEIAAAQIALTKSSSAAVKAFAQQMITDHTSMDQLLMNAVRSIKPEHMVPGLLTPKQQLMLDRLNAATVDFDAEYKAQMIESHQETLDLLQMFIDSKYGNTVLKGVAQGAVPVVTMHLQMAQGLVL
ncbi:hypothetical protein DC3_24070 [Deinococcus cellulosilyticus NBRC 106333 = KACC 11606]|uniref:DUF4142 domain-containing protein n=2 Tax=Deinococcus cellulosilyticus TaxID=401558 RepID=A0A511N1M7_DEIC1|nr:hypothetical protein DC3_24070 [Deinococcus cellulosilyticus NBRC 106333 = KACC 11606]